MPFVKLEDRVHAALPQRFGATITFGELAARVGRVRDLGEVLRSLAARRVISFGDPEPALFHDALVILKNDRLLPTEFYTLVGDEDIYPQCICTGKELLEELLIPERSALITVDARSGHLFLSNMCDDVVAVLSPENWYRAH